MRRYIKNEILDLLNTLLKADKSIKQFISSGKRDNESFTTLLQDCQDAAISVGNSIESSEGEETDAVKHLEEYCELLYRFSTGEEKATYKLDTCINGCINEIKQLPERIEAVFLPYKASMWDSLESVWMAADADPDCDAYVIPIPYYDKNPDGSFKAEHYEKDLYSEDIPVTDYREYSITDRHPEMIFIHNPYDEYNHVTSVHPDYYSHVLKQYTDCLVYIPYYATAGNMAAGHSLLPAYYYADYIITQSESMVGFFDKQVPREKILPLGSPKFDKVIRACQNPPIPPEEWAEKMNGKRVFFYNTSLDGFLKNTEQFLKKMAYVFDTFKGRDDVCLLWRPHPLLESTIDSMRPEYKPVYESLKKYFVDENIGILDKTPEIESTIAFCDAYLGDAGTSVTSLFGVVGKRIYILNNRITSAPEEDDWKTQVCQTLRRDRNNKYCITMGNRLFEDREGNYHYKFMCNLSDEYLDGGYYRRALEEDGKIIVFPANAEHLLIVDPLSLSKRKIDLCHRVDQSGAFSDFINDFLETPYVFWLLPNRYGAVVRINTKTEEISNIEDEAFTDEYSVYVDLQGRRIIAARWVFYNKTINRGTEEPTIIDSPEEDIAIPGMKMKGRRLFCLNINGTRLRAINLDTGETEERTISLNGLYINVFRDRENMDVIWFLPYEGTELGKWTLSEDKWEKVNVSIEGLKSIQRPQRLERNCFYFSNGIFIKGKLILSPNWGNKFIELDTYTHEVKEWTPPFSYTLEDKNDYWFNGSIGFFYEDPWTLEAFYHYTPERKTYSVNLSAGTYQEIPITFDKKEIIELSKGFHRSSKWMPYCCFEDVMNSLQDIVQGQIHGSEFDKDRQIEAYSSVNASPEGNCGKKVFETVKR